MSDIKTTIALFFKFYFTTKLTFEGEPILQINDNFRTIVDVYHAGSVILNIWWQMTVAFGVFVVPDNWQICKLRLVMLALIYVTMRNSVAFATVLLLFESG